MRTLFSRVLTARRSKGPSWDSRVSSSSAGSYAYNVKKGNFKKSAEKFAGDFKDKFLKKYLKSRRVAGS